MLFSTPNANLITLAIESWYRLLSVYSWKRFRSRLIPITCKFKPKWTWIIHIQLYVWDVLTVSCIFKLMPTVITPRTRMGTTTNILLCCYNWHESIKVAVTWHILLLNPRNIALTKGKSYYISSQVWILSTTSICVHRKLGKTCRVVQFTLLEYTG